MAYGYDFGCTNTGAGNAGIGNCNIDLKNVRGAILLPKGTSFKESDMPAFLATLKTLATADNWAARIQIVKKFEGVEASNVDANEQNYGYGRTVIVEEEKMGRTYTLTGKCLQRALRNSVNDKHNSFDIMFIHDDNIINGTAYIENGEVMIKGFALDLLRVGPYNETQGDTLPMFTFRVQLANSDEWDNSYAIKVSDGNVMAELNSLIDLQLTYVPAIPVVPGTYSIAVNDCSNSGVLDVYSTEIVEPTNWIAENPATGAAIDIDSITIASDRLLFALDTADADFTSATRIRIKGAAVSVLSGNDIVGFEIGKVEFPKA